MTKRIPLTRGRFALVDDADYEWLSQRKWQYTEPKNRNGRGYATHGYQVRVNGERRNRCLRMHRLIVDCPAGKFVDHLDGNTLNNTRANLRICTQRQSLRNMKKIQTYKGQPTASIFKGVFRAGKNGWAAKLQNNGKSIYLGCHPTEETAARAYDAAAREHFKEFAALNFPKKTEQSSNPRNPDSRGDMEETAENKYTAELGTSFVTFEDDADNLLYITTAYGYGFAIPLADFREYVNQHSKD